MRKFRLILLLFTLFFGAAIYPEKIRAASTIPTIEVKLVNYLGNKTSITVVFNGEYKLSNGVKVTSGTEAVIKLSNSKLSMETSKGQVLIEKESSISAAPVKTDGTLSVNGRKYNGSFQFVIEKDTKNGNLYVRPINKVDIETYLRGVVPQEMPALWSMEALKAQTVAARTYAIKHMNDSNMVDTIAKQVYGGSSANHARSDTAVKETEGMVIKYNGALIDAVFSASNGGWTELNSSVWGGAALSYFAVKEDTFDFNPATKDKFTWSIQLKQEQLPATLNLAIADTWWNTLKEADADNTVLINIKKWLVSEGYTNDVAKIKIAKIHKLGVDLTSLSAGGRVLKGTLKMDYLLMANGKTAEKKVLEMNGTAASKIRAIVGIDRMTSYLIDETVTKKGSIYMKGRGNGHAVGLSQYGARNRAEAGHSYNQILQFYYPKAALMKEYSGTASNSQGMDDKVPPNISSFKASIDYKKNTTKLSMKINKSGKLTMIVKDSKGKTVATIAKNKEVKSGSLSLDWNISKVENATYTAEIIASNKDGYQKTAYHKVTVKKDKAPPAISSFKASTDNKKNTVKLGMKTNKAGKITIVLKDSRGKTVATLVKNKEVKSGSLSFSWNISKAGNGTYTAEITTENLHGYKNTMKQKIKIKKPVKVKKASVKPSVLNLRQKPNTSSKVILKLKKKQTVVILSQQGSWYKVKYGSKTGYVSAKYVTILK
ncbi:SpoIID/LytB domain-containing protein [Niallia taxi]|uniref:SpoIID/LytB domain-containing protein n=1 Tax=Niallia taxi TaxID=2499688 RepID=UPI0011A336E5